MGQYLSGVTPLRRYPRTVQVPSPAAGSDWSYTVPGGVMWRLVSVLGQLVTSAVVATRSPVLSLSDGDVEFARIPSTGTQAASLTGRYTFAVGLDAVNTANVQSQAIPECLLRSGAVVRTVTGAIDAGDQWSGVALYVIETMIGAGPIDLNAVPDMVVIAMPAGGSGAAGA